jgi:hypothetical protein
MGSGAPRLPEILIFLNSRLGGLNIRLLRLVMCIRGEESWQVDER